MTDSVKIVLNACYGGFSLSREAVLYARKLSGDPNWGGPTTVGDTYSCGEPVTHHYGYIDKIARTDPVLVATVEALGDKASGQCANLRVSRISKGTRYRIEEYDGFERLETEDDVRDWAIA